MFPLRAIFASLLGLLLASAAQAGAVLSIDYAETTHVTTSGFSAVFESSLPASPSIAVYSDANGASEITDQFEVSIYPFQGGDPAAADEIAQADAADALAAAAQARGLAKIRVHGGAPGTTYYYRVTAGENGSSVTFPAGGATLAVTTMAENSFITQSAQVLVTLTTTDPLGSLVTLSSDETLHGLASLVGDGASPSQAFFNLNHMFESADANWDPNGTKVISLTLRQGGGQTTTTEFPVEFVGGFAVAATYQLNLGDGAILITVLEPSVNSYTVGEDVLVSWQDDFPAADATISLFYDTDDSGEDGTLIVAGLSEETDGPDDSFDWDTTGVADGTYFVYATVTDTTLTESSYGAGQVTIDRNMTDGDADFMSDLWEGFYFGDLTRDGTGDFDNDGNPDGNEFDDDTNPGVPDVRLALLEGLNLFSFPLDLDPAMTSGDLLTQISGTAIEISRLSGGVVETTRLVSGVVEGTVFPIVGGEGYHLELSGDYEAVWEGLAISGERDLTAGVNLVGFPSIPSGYTANDFLQAIGTDSVVASVRRFNRDDGRFETKTYVGAQPVGQDFAIERGSGYIVDMRDNVTGFLP